MEHWCDLGVLLFLGHVCLPVCLSVCLFVSLSVCLSVFMYVWPAPDPMG